MRLQSTLSLAAFTAAILVPGLALATATASPGWENTPFSAELLAAKSSMMAEPQRAFAHAQAARTLADKDAPGAARDMEIATASWLSGEALTRLKHPEQALPILDEALAVVSRAGPDTKLQGDLLKSRGRAAAAIGRVQPALSDFQAAYGIYAKTKDARSEAMALQEIGSIYSAARDYPHVLQYNAQSRDTYSADPALLLTATNNRAFALKDMGKLNEAEAEFRKALDAANALHSAYIEAHILTNIAFTEALAGKLDAARRDAQRGLAIAAHDSEARGERPFLIGVLAKVALDTGDVATSVRYLDQVFAGADLATTPMDYRDFHEIASRAYEAAGDRTRALEHLKAFKRLDDQGRTLAASTNAALVAAKFDFANQATKIAELKVSQAQSKARLTTIIISILILGGLIVTSLITHAFFTMRRSRNRIRAVNHELEATNSSLQKALKARTDFLATTSHEIRTPLNGILGMTQVLLADRDMSPSARERLSLLKSSGDAMNAMVSDLLDVAKIEKGTLTISRTEIGLRALLEDAAKVWRDHAQNKGLELKVDLGGCPERAIEDGDRLRQVLFNLMSNATKFTETGWVSLSASVTSANDSERLSISVTDSGIGIPAIECERIFEAFSQVDGEKSRQYAGAGLGLSICRNVAHALGGEVTVRSVPGEGSTFTLDLPLQRVETPAADAVGAGLAKTSLIVLDDNLLSQALLRAVLSAKVKGLAMVASYEEALEAAASGDADHFLLDGSFLSRAFEARAIECAGRLAQATSAPVDVLWPNPSPEQEAQLVAAGVRMVIAKPIAPTALVQLLEGAGPTPKMSKADAHAA
jgi:signal transduction histidine kinase